MHATLAFAILLLPIVLTLLFLDNVITNEKRRLDQEHDAENKKHSNKVLTVLNITFLFVFFGGITFTQKILLDDLVLNDLYKFALSFIIIFSPYKICKYFLKNTAVFD